MNIWYLQGTSCCSACDTTCICIWLLMNKPIAEGAFVSIQYIMRDVKYGYIIRYMHTTGASAFALIFLHMFQDDVRLLSKPRELLWVLKDYIFLTLRTWIHGICSSLGTNVLWAAQVIMFPLPDSILVKIYYLDKRYYYFLA